MSDIYEWNTCVSYKSDIFEWSEKIFSGQIPSRYVFQQANIKGEKTKISQKNLCSKINPTTIKNLIGWDNFLVNIHPIYLNSSQYLFGKGIITMSLSRVISLKRLQLTKKSATKKCVNFLGRWLCMSLPAHIICLFLPPPALIWKFFS
jgi:hypothetical protein